MGRLVGFIGVAGVAAQQPIERFLVPADEQGERLIVALCGEAGEACIRRVVIHAAGTGEVWIVPLGELQDFDASLPPSLSLGLDSVVSVAPDGLLFAYSAEVGASECAT